MPTLDIAAATELRNLLLAIRKGRRAYRAGHMVEIRRRVEEIEAVVLNSPSDAIRRRAVKALRTAADLGYYQLGRVGNISTACVVGLAFRIALFGVDRGHDWITPLGCQLLDFVA